MCECGERLVIVMGTMDLVCEGCGYIATPARLKYKQEKVNVAKPVREPFDPYRKEVRIIDTGQYSEDDFTIMGLLNILALQALPWMPLDIGVASRVGMMQNRVVSRC